LARDVARVGVHHNANEAAAKEAVGSIKAADGSAFTLQTDPAEPHAAQSLHRNNESPEQLNGFGIPAVVRSTGPAPVPTVERRPHAATAI
jgi:hypothetical protein